MFKTIDKNSCYRSFNYTNWNIRVNLVSILCLIKMITQKVRANNDESLNQVLPLFKSFFFKCVNTDFENCTCSKCGRWLVWNDALAIWTLEFWSWMNKNSFIILLGEKSFFFVTIGCFDFRLVQKFSKIQMNMKSLKPLG